jgi:hypothetical protein
MLTTNQRSPDNCVSYYMRFKITFFHYRVLLDLKWHRRLNVERREKINLSAIYLNDRIYLP